MILQHGRVGEIYNVGAGEERSKLEIVRLICRTLNKTESLIQFVEDRKGHDVRYSLDVSKIRNELGWCPETAFDVGMAKTIQWYEEEYGENALYIIKIDCANNLSQIHFQPLVYRVNWQ